MHALDRPDTSDPKNNYIKYDRLQGVTFQQLYVLPTLYLCVLYLSEIKQRLVPLQHKLIGFYNSDEKCLQRGTDWG